MSKLGDVLEGIDREVRRIRGDSKRSADATYFALWELYRLIIGHLERSDGEKRLIRELQEHTKIGPLPRQRSVFLWAVNAYCEESVNLPAHTRSRWAKALEAAHVRDIPPDQLVGFIKEQGGLQAAALLAKRKPSRMRRG